MKKCLSVILSVLLIGSLMSGCGSSSSPQSSSGSSGSSSAVSPASPAPQAESGDLLAEDGAELTILGGAHLVSVTEAVLGDFMAQHPEIKINFEKYSYAEYPIKMKTQLSNKESVPDIVLVHDSFISQFIKAGYLMELNDIMTPDDFMPVLDPVTVDGKYYALPNQVSLQYVFLYRKDIYDQLSLQPPSTFDEYFEQALVLKENGYYAGAYDPADSNCFEVFRNYVYMLGGDFYDQDANFVFDKGEEALKLIEKCYDAGIWHKSRQANSDAYWTAYNDGKIAAFPGPASNAAYYETNVDPNGKGGYGDISLAPAFTFTGGPSTYINNTEFFAINKNTKYPNAAKILISYLCQSVEATEKFSNVQGEGLLARYANGYIPGLNALAENGTSGWDAFGGQQVVSILAKDLLESKPSLPYVDERQNEAQTIISEVIGEMFLNNAYTPEQAVQEMRKRLSAI